MPQNPNDMMFCNKCKMNVYPGRPELSMVALGITAIITIIILSIISLIIMSLFLGLFVSFYFIWGFMCLNPYLIIYSLKKKEYCPKCYNRAVEKNIEYKPFGNKEPEGFVPIGG